MGEDNTEIEANLFGVSRNSTRALASLLLTSSAVLANRQCTLGDIHGVMHEINNIRHDPPNDVESQATGLESLVDPQDEVLELRHQMQTATDQLQAAPRREVEMANDISLLQAQLEKQAEQVAALLQLKARDEKKPAVEKKEVEPQASKQSVSQVYMNPGPRERRRSENRRKTIIDLGKGS